jgi:cysteinyl-tRNA synthetase
MHGGLLQFDGRKMSKSLGNFEPLRDLLERHDPQAIRLLFLQAGYRKPLNFTETSIAGFTTGLRRLQAAYDALRTAPAASNDADRSVAEAFVAPYRTKFFAALDDDVNTSGAVSVLFDLANVSNEAIASGAASAASAFMHEALGLLGISPSEREREPAREKRVVTTEFADDSAAGGIVVEGPADAEDVLPGDTVARLRDLVPPDVVHLNGHSKTAAVEAVIRARIAAKKERDFKRADALRDALKAVGVTFNDRKDGGGSWTVGD